MLDQSAPAADKSSTAPSVTYDLVVVGAGIAGLNALHAAVGYLPKGARVLLIDQKPGAGGMWNTAYDYVRLHQPHPMFTVGDMGWDWTKPRSYLAARDEVRDHLASALGLIGASVDLQTRFGHTVTECVEVNTDKGHRARISFHPNDDAGSTDTVIALRAVHASGLDYHLADPLPLSSDAVLSIIPQDLLTTLDAHPDAPVYVVGGGKTGMDTVLATLGKGGGRRVELINGRGTNFLNRTKLIPTGIDRWTSGMLFSRVFRDIAQNFDGDNEEQTLTHLRQTYSSDPGAANGVFLYGFQSEEEHARIGKGVHRVHKTYLADVTDTADGIVMTLRDGSTAPVESGSIFVNCTGSFFRSEDWAAKQPLVSPHDTVVTINPRDSWHFLTSVTGFFVMHLLYRDALRGKGFYTLDHEALFRQNRNAWVGASAAQAYMNQTIAVQTLPLTLLDRCGLDIDRWYPLPRRLIGLVQMKAGAKSDIAACRATLDRVADRFGVQCATLS